MLTIFTDLPNTRSWRCKLRKMHVFRHWVTLLLQKLRSYMMLIVPQCLGDKLIESIVEINNFTLLQESKRNDSTIIVSNVSE